MATIIGNPDVHPTQVIRSIVAALVADGHIDATGQAGTIMCYDAGVPVGESVGNGILAQCSDRHGLQSSDRVRIVGTNGMYDGEYEIEPKDDYAFYPLNASYVSDSSGRWEPL